MTEVQLGRQEALRVLREADYAGPFIGKSMTEEMIRCVRNGLMAVTLDEDRRLRFRGVGRWAK